jgi:hypothetical protein
VGAKFEILLNKPHWDNDRRIERAFIDLARQYKNDSTIGNVFGKPLRGRRVKNDYVFDSSNSDYPYASRIPFKEEVSANLIYLMNISYWKNTI